MRFENQVAIVTGAGRGIGQATALRLANEGARVACVSRTEANAKNIANQINAIRADAGRAYTVDVADHAAVHKIGGQILGDFGRADILINNAGVNAVAPGFITTDMTAGLSEEVKNSIQSKIPLGKTGTPEDIANAVAFLASSEAGYITGQVLCVDGGIVM
jgi:NAD(P)-dependent dehydrogenase (short-subunit alcohol dehydrogenase family)